MVRTLSSRIIVSIILIIIIIIMNMQTVFERYKCYGFVGDTPLYGDCSYEWWLNLNFEENEGVGVGVVSLKTGR